MHNYIPPSYIPPSYILILPYPIQILVYYFYAQNNTRTMIMRSTSFEHRNNLHNSLYNAILTQHALSPNI